MPAIELNTHKADKIYGPKQRDLLKLWQIFTANDFVSNDATQIFNTTKEAQDYHNSQAGSEDKSYYLDLQKLNTKLPSLSAENMQSVASVLQQHRPIFQWVSHQLWQQGVAVVPYGVGGNCTSVPIILDPTDNT